MASLFNFTGAHVATIIAGAVLLYAAVTLNLFGRAIHNKPIMLKDVSSCLDLLQGDYFDVTDKAQDPLLFLRLGSRAGPNQRLRRTFFIDNAFTTMDKATYRSFVREAVYVIGFNDMTWFDVACKTRFALTTLHEAQDTYRSYLVPFIQSFVLNISIAVLYGWEVTNGKSKEIGILGNMINELWISSKTRPQEDLFTDDQKDEQERLCTAMHDIFPDWQANETENPLNLIIPTYETLWRIVLRIFLEVTLRIPATEKAIYLELFCKYMVDPTAKRLEAIVTVPGSPSVDASLQMLVNEGLRLYPPTRRIYRRLDTSLISRSAWPEWLPKSAQSPKTIDVAADIEALHRDPQIWGRDALLFRPSRWAERSEVHPDKSKIAKASAAFVPFGARPFACPARERFAPRMIALLVAALLEGMGMEDCKVGLGGLEWRVIESQCGHSGLCECEPFTLEVEEPLLLTREAYQNLMIVPA
ncbi:hypothetical protein MMC25_003964 [Agyrium rufum]|nr:hypothetical protein [Agyrium rufum]